MYPRLTVRELVKLFGSFFPQARPEMELVNLVGLADKAEARVLNLSGGQMQKLAIAIALVNDGDLIFLDEPTTGLDPQARRDLWDVIMEFKKAGKTVFLTTHYMDEAEKLCDRVAVVDHGRIIAQGSPQQLITENFKERALELSQPELDGDSRLEKLPGVNRVQFDEEVITIYTTEVPHTIASLMEMTAADGISVNDLVVRQATLEDVFLKLTGRRIRE